MKRFRFKKIDAFTGARSPGNPAGCVYPGDTGSIEEPEMLEIARQLKGYVSEVAYVFPEGEGLFLRYFSSEREVDFCGHATVAVLFDYFTDPANRATGSTAIRVGGDTLTVWNETGRGGGVFIASPPPRFLRAPAQSEDIARALRIEPAELDGRYPVALVNAGLNSLLVPMRRASTLTDILPVFEELLDFCQASGVDIVVPFTDDKILPGSNYRTRVFAPRFGYLEDPATGSGNAALGAMLLREGFWKGGELTIEQGRSYRDPNIVKLRPSGQGQGVLFGGGATVRIDGMYCLN